MKKISSAGIIVGAVAGFLIIAGIVAPQLSPGPHQPPVPSRPAQGVAGSVYRPPDTALELYKKGLNLYYQRQYQPALALFNRALALDPGCYQALNAKGATYAFLGRYDEGIAMIKQAIGMKPDFEYAHFNLGLAYELAGRWNPAIAAYKSAIALNPKDEWTYYGIAAIYGRQGNVPMTVRYLRLAIDRWSGVKKFARTEQDFDRVRGDPRFQALVK